MAKPDPLHTVLKLAVEAEEQAALQLKAAQMECQRRKSQLQALQEYRLDYMKQLDAQQGRALAPPITSSFIDLCVR